MKFSQLHNRLPKRILLYSAGILFLLSFATLYYFQRQPSIKQEEKKLERFLHSQQRDFEQFFTNTVLISRLVRQTESLDTFRNLIKKEYGIFLYAETLQQQELLFWNTQKILPPKADSLADGEYFKQLANGYYVIIKKSLRLPDISNNIIAYAMIPVLYKYDVPSDYLVTHFTYDKEATNKILLSPDKTPYLIHSLHNKPLFYIEKKAQISLAANDSITAILRIMAFILLLAYLHFITETVTKKKGAVRAILFLTFVLIAVRVALYIFPNIFSFRQFQLFDPTIYAASWFNRSLGDLLINAVFFCWIVVFAWYSAGSAKKIPSFLQGTKLLVAGVAALSFLIFSTFQLANVVRSLVADSKISFNVTDFFSLNVYTVGGFIILALLSLSYYYFTRLLFRIVFPAFKNRSIYIYFLLALTGLIILTFRSGNSVVLFHLPVLGWLIIYTVLLSQEQFIINRFKITVAGILFWIFIFSLSLAAIILHQNKQKEWSLRKSIAEKLDQVNDPSSESTLRIATTYLDNEFLSGNFWRFQNETESRLLRDSIISQNITGYLNTYDTKVFVFDSYNQGLFNDEPVTYEELNNIFTLQSKPTQIPDLYYHETSYDKYTYITKRTITNSGSVRGTFFLISTPKTYNPDALYPELFRANRNEAENSSVYHYAIYNNNMLISPSNKYPFQITITDQQIPTEEFTARTNGDYDELWYKPNSNKVIVIAKKSNSFIESITLFSYLFCAFLLMVALLQLVSLLLKAVEDWRVLNGLWQLNIRSQVHSTIIFISVLSFAIIGAATISFFISRYNRNNIDKLSRTGSIVVNEMQKRLVDYSTFDDVIKIHDSVANSELQNFIEDVTDVHNVDVNVYDEQGNLQVTSQAEVYKKGILSSKMHPEAFYHLRRLRQVQYVQEEAMSSLRYLSIYATVRNDKGQVYAYLNIPYFLSQIDLNQEISNFLITIINLNAFIFLIAGIIALFITNRITRSFSVIGDKMKEITLGKTNEQIKWDRNDELGELIKQYNKMVLQLEESAEVLAKSEREGAWREMARQVAHEIKNPLTPMKLSIQHLQKAINNNNSNVKELTSSVAKTLVEQIDHLSKIAADFSRFANIGNRNMEQFDLHHVLQNLKDLYSANPKINFVWNTVKQKVLINADKTHMNRLFTNLITNSIDACNKNKCQIEIIETMEEDHILVQVKDNGHGILPEMKQKIFTPNFTTKSSGTGLGLAMCKSIVEQAEGFIWFETEVGKGTTFFVRLPVLNSAP
ncbi:MAG: ATP-binding protein [Chitinophagaceae bacterium]